MSLKIKPARIFLCAVILTLVFMTVTIVKYKKSGDYLNNFELHQFNDNWTYIDSLEVKHSITLPKKVACRENATVILENTLPKVTMTGFSLCFRSKQQFVKVFIEGEEIYSYGYSSSSRISKAPTSAWQMIPLDESYKGKKVRIELRSPYKKYAGAISEIVYCNKYDFQSYIFKTYIPNFIVSCVLLSLAVFIFLVSLLAIAFKKEFMTLFYISMCSLLMGIWSLGESKITQFLYADLDFILVLTLLALMLAPLPYLLYMRELISSKYSRYINYMMIIIGINFGICVSFQLLHYKDLVETIDSTLFLGLLCIIIVHVLLIYEYLREREKSKKLYPAAYLSMTGILLIFVAVEIIAYYSSVFKDYGLFLRIGILLYMAELTLSVVVRYMDLLTEANELKDKLMKSQITLMLSQIQPHFLYNTLTAIRTLIKKKPDEAYTLVGYFSRYLRANLNSINGQDLIPFTQELNHIKTYVNIELVRFNNRFEVIYDIESEDFEVPPLSIQPIVENAIKHGVCKVVEGGVVTIRTRQVNSINVIEVIDNGIGFNINEYEKNDMCSGEANHSSVGIKNIKMRLVNICNASFKIQSIEGCGTIVTVGVPCKK